MDIPFKLTFFEGHSNGESFSNFANDFKNAIENEDEYCFSCRELSDFRLLFESDKPNLSLWIEVMDILSIESFNNSERKYERFEPSSEIRPLYLNEKSKYNEQETKYSSLLPGLYRMVVYENNKEKYYSFIKIEPRHINQNQLEIMREEIEMMLNGLAKEVSYSKRLSIYTDNNELIQKYHFLVAKAELLIINLKLIEKEPKYNINKTYISKIKGQASKSDLYTIKHAQINFKNPHKTLGYKYDLNYNVSVNNNLKEMLQSILKDTTLVVAFLNRNSDRLYEEIQIQSKYKTSTLELVKNYEMLTTHLKKLTQLKANIIFILTRPWLVDLKSDMKNQDKLPRVPYYRTVYALFQQLRQNVTLKLNPLQNYMYSWKETSKLYEIWGFLKFLMMLKEDGKLGITQIRGWIFDNNYEGILPFLDSGTEIILSNNVGLELVVRYDSFIKKALKYEETSFDNSITTLKNNTRPDMRIDIYYKGHFKKCIIAEFKYRNRASLGSQEQYRLNQHHSIAYQQIINYTEVRSFYENRSKNNPLKSSRRAIAQVFAVFPKTDDVNAYFNDESMTDIIICSLSPGMQHDKISERISDIIIDLIED